MKGNFQQTLNSLPSNVKKIFLSEFQRVISLELRKKYKLSLDQGGLLEEIITNLYFGEERFDKLVNLLQTDLKINDKTAHDLAKDVIGKKFIIVSNSFKDHNNDPLLTLTSLGGHQQDYSRDVELLKKAVAEEEAGTYQHTNYLYKDEISPKKIQPEIIDETVVSEIDLNKNERLEAVKNILEENLLEVLQAENNTETIHEINDSLIEVLNEIPSSQTEIERLISNNKALLTQNSILVDGKQALPTASTWLKDFQKIGGTDNIDSLILTQYFVNSPNAKILPEAEKKVLRKFLLLYNNIKFFTKIFNNMPVEQWHIIPSIEEKTSQFSDKALPKTPIQQPKPVSTFPKPRVVEKKINSPQSSIPMSTPKSIIKSNPQPIVSIPKASSKPTISIDHSDEVMNLKNMLLQYPADSLERKAIEEEIKKLS